MKSFRMNPENKLEFGVYTLGDHLPDPRTNKRISAQKRLRQIIEMAQLAEEVGLDFFSVGESHQEYFTTQAHTVVLGAIAQATEKIKIGSSSTIISTLDPVRVYEDFSTIDLISNGRAEIIAGRASRLGVFDLLGYDIQDYEALFEEKFALLLELNEKEIVTWNGNYRKSLDNAMILPQPKEEKLPIWRAVGGGPQSAVKAGINGVPMFIATLGGAAESFQYSIGAYRESLSRMGHDPQNFPVSTAGFFYTAETTQQAFSEVYPHVNEGMKRTNGQGFPKQHFAQGMDSRNVMNIGSPEQIVEKILYQHELFNHQRYIAQLDFGGIPHDRIMKNIEVLGTKIMPEVRNHL